MTPIHEQLSSDQHIHASACMETNAHVHVCAHTQIVIIILKIQNKISLIDAIYNEQQYKYNLKFSGNIF